MIGDNGRARFRRDGMVIRDRKAEGAVPREYVALRIAPARWEDRAPRTPGRIELWCREHPYAAERIAVAVEIAFAFFMGGVLVLWWMS